MSKLADNENELAENDGRKQEVILNSDDPTHSLTVHLLSRYLMSSCSTALSCVSNSIDSISRNSDVADCTVGVHMMLRFRRTAQQWHSVRARVTEDKKIYAKPAKGKHSS